MYALPNAALARDGAGTTPGGRCAATAAYVAAADMVIAVLAAPPLLGPRAEDVCVGVSWPGVVAPGVVPPGAPAPAAAAAAVLGGSAGFALGPALATLASLSGANTGALNTSASRFTTEGKFAAEPRTMRRFGRSA